MRHTYRDTFYRATFFNTSSAKKEKKKKKLVLDANRDLSSSEWRTRVQQFARDHEEEEEERFTPRSQADARTSGVDSEQSRVNGNDLVAPRKT